MALDFKIVIFELRIFVSNEKTEKQLQRDYQSILQKVLQHAQSLFPFFVFLLGIQYSATRRK